VGLMLSKQRVAYDPSVTPWSDRRGSSQTGCRIHRVKQAGWWLCFVFMKVTFWICSMFSTTSLLIRSKIYVCSTHFHECQPPISHYVNLSTILHNVIGIYMDK
jgi:hypothetical protein